MCSSLSPACGSRATTRSARKPVSVARRSGDLEDEVLVVPGGTREVEDSRGNRCLLGDGGHDEVFDDVAQVPGLRHDVREDVTHQVSNLSLNLAMQLSS